MLFQHSTSNHQALAMAVSSGLSGFGLSNHLKSMEFLAGAGTRPQPLAAVITPQGFGSPVQVIDTWLKTHGVVK